MRGIHLAFVWLCNWNSNFTRRCGTWLELCKLHFLEHYGCYLDVEVFELLVGTHS